MKNKNRIHNFIYIILLLFFFVIGFILLNNHSIQAQRSFNYNFAYVTLIIIVFYGGIGMLLGFNNSNLSLENLRKENIRKIKINRTKLLVGIPFFMLSMTHLVMYSKLYNKLTFLSSLTTLEINQITIVSSIILGHTVISALYID